MWVMGLDWIPEPPDHKSTAWAVLIKHHLNLSDSSALRTNKVSIAPKIYYVVQIVWLDCLPELGAQLLHFLVFVVVDINPLGIFVENVCTFKEDKNILWKKQLKHFKKYMFENTLSKTMYISISSVMYFLRKKMVIRTLTTLILFYYWHEYTPHPSDTNLIYPD